MTQTLAGLAADLAAGRTTSEQLVSDCLTRIADGKGEGRQTYLEVDSAAACATAREMDALRRAGAEPSPYAGIPVSVKDLFDVRGQVTRAGSRVLDGPPAASDATVVARCRRAGLVLVGRTNMTEFAFSGLGINPHYGTPANPWDRSRRRIPGGSSSGAAVSVSDEMAYGALGTDTGGSCRIPAALCGLVGFKPTQARVPRDGSVPLSPTLDTVGVIARTVACCAILDSLLCEGSAPPPILSEPPVLAVVRDYFLADADEHVRSSFERMLRRLSEAGADLIEVDLPDLNVIPEINAGGGFAAFESFAWHHDLIAQRGSDYDPRVLVRILRGEALSPDNLALMRRDRHALIEGTRKRLGGFDAFVCPTVPLIAPPLDALEDDAEYSRINLLMLRNPTAINLLDGCAVSVPMHQDGEPPTGLMVSGLAGQDAQILGIGRWIEELR